MMTRATATATAVRAITRLSMCPLLLGGTEPIPLGHPLDRGVIVPGGGGEPDALDADQRDVREVGDVQVGQGVVRQRLPDALLVVELARAAGGGTDGGHGQHGSGDGLPVDELHVPSFVD